MKLTNKSVLFVSIAIAVFVLAVLLRVCNQKESFSSQEDCNGVWFENSRKCCRPPKDGNNRCKYDWCRASEGYNDPEGNKKGRGGCHWIYKNNCMENSESGLNNKKVIEKCQKIFKNYDKEKYINARNYWINQCEGTVCA